MSTTPAAIEDINGRILDATSTARDLSTKANTAIATGEWTRAAGIHVARDEAMVRVDKLSRLRDKWIAAAAEG